MRRFTLLLTLLIACPAARPDRTMRFANDGAKPPERDPSRKKRFDELVPKLDRLFLDAVDTNHVAGLAVGMVLDGQVVYLKGFGVQDLESNIPFGVDSPFRVASLTKSITALAILKLRDEGKLALDDPAARYYPALAKLAYPTRDSPPITIRDLLTHTSGLPEDNYYVDGAGTVPESHLNELVESGMRFSRAPDSGYEYSNTGYALLGKVIEGAAGRPAREYIRREILLPLGMRSSAFRLEDVDQNAVVAGYRGQSGYHVAGDAARTRAPIDPLGVYETAGGLYASIRDMTAYLAFQLSAWPPRDDLEAGPVKRSSLREMQQGARQADPRSFPRVLLPSRRPAAVRRGELFQLSYGYGFFATTTCDDVFYIHHDGQLPGYTSTLSFFPARGFGIVMFVNDERLKTEPTEEAVAILRSAGVLDPLPSSPVPALDGAKKEVERLFVAWDEERAKRLFAPAFWRYQPPEKLQEQLAALRAAHGACRTEGQVEVNNLTRGRWRTACEKGEIAFVIVLSPEAEPRLQALLWEDAVSPNAGPRRANCVP